MCCRAWKIKEWRSTCQHVPLVQQGLLLMCRRMKTLQSWSCRLRDLLLCPRSWDFCPQVLSATSACPRMQFALKFPNGHSLPSPIMACYLCADAVGYELGAELLSRSHGFVLWESQSGQESVQLTSKKARLYDWFEHQTKTLLYVRLLPQGSCSGDVTEMDGGSLCPLPCAQRGTAETQRGWWMAGLLLCLQGN